MRFVSYQGPRNTPSMGVLAGQRVAALTPLDEFYADVRGWTLEARALSSGAASLALEDLILVPPALPSAKVICAAINYRAHGEESDLPSPPHPNLFARWATNLVPTGTEIPIPASEPGRDGIAGMDWEVELAVIMGDNAVDVTRDEAMDSVFGYTVFNDVSGRRSQLEASELGTGQWGLGKNADSSGPIGSVIVTTDEVDVAEIELEARIGDEVLQSGSAAAMIFGVPELIEFITKTITLRPGDVIATGTPAGVGLGRNPRRFLQPGEIITVSLVGICSISNPMIERNRAMPNRSTVSLPERDDDGNPPRREVSAGKSGRR